MDDEDGIAGEAVEIVEIAALGPLSEASTVFSEAELTYARSKSDPERRLAARLAAKRAALRLLAGELSLRDIEVVRGAAGPPHIRLSARAQGRLRDLGARGMITSLTHGETHAAATVLLLRET